MSFKVVNTIQLPGVDFGGELLQDMDAVFVEKPGRTEDEIIATASDADAVICSGPVQPWTSRVIANLSQCRIIASLGVGYDRIDLAKATEKGIVVTNIPDYCIDEVSTQTIALVLAWAAGYSRWTAWCANSTSILCPPTARRWPATFDLYSG